MSKNVSYENIVIVGTGRIAHSVVQALKNTGLHPTHVLYRTEERGEKFAARFAIPNIIHAHQKFPDGKTLYIVAVSDDAIAEVSELLAAQCESIDRTVFMHLSGSYAASELKALHKKRAHVASFHIMQTFPDTTPIPLANLRAIIETRSEYAFEQLSALAEQLQLIQYRLTSDQKTLYHITGIFISNFLVGNVHNAGRIFSKTGLSQTEFYDIFTPILMTTVRNVLQKGSADSLSGPLERGDRLVIEKHIELLADEFRNENDLLKNYISQSLALINCAESKNRGKKDIYAEMAKVLEERLKTEQNKI